MDDKERKTHSIVRFQYIYLYKKKCNTKQTDGNAFSDDTYKLLNKNKIMKLKKEYICRSVSLML